ncbi:MAG: polysaccharide deacetylase [Thermoleophilia bacterium]|nr:polysaccharide deacetylase [Thermoleophilia bacterium]
MTGKALILTFHGVERGPSPLCISPERFQRHLDDLLEAGVRTLTVSELADAVRADAVPDLTVAITFDGAVRSAVCEAAPLLAVRDLRATFFCSAGGLGDGGSRRTSSDTPWLELATASELAQLASGGFEIGSQGFNYEPLVTDDVEVLQREILGSKRILEQVTSTAVRSFALRDGASTSRAARRLLGGAYDAVCTSTPAHVHRWSHPLALPRVDINYVDSPYLLRLAAEGRGDSYLRLRWLAARARRNVRRGTHLRRAG